MKKINTFIKKYYPEILSIIVPIIILLVASVFSKIYPLGTYSFAKYDGYYQYPGFTSYFKKVLLGQESLFYSFKGLLGYNFYATAIYYMFNPTNLLCIFSNNNNILIYYTFLVYLRIALCGFTMCKYLRYKYKDKPNMYLVIFSIAYALMAYNVCYFFNFMYFDVVALFPIVMIGLEKLIYEKKVTLYIISLTITIISNFYIGYMVCIFSALYFIYNYILLENKDKKIIKKFIISSLLAGLMCSIILLPVIYELFQGKVELYKDSIQTNYFDFNLNFLNFFYKATPGSTVTYDIKYGTVNIYCSLLVIISVIKYFFNTKISTKEKIVTGSFIAFFLLSISFNLIDYFWHLMQRPIWYPNRYIFTFDFFLIMIAYKSIKYNSYVKMNWVVRLIVCFAYIALMSYPAKEAAFIDKLMPCICFIVTIMLLFEYVFFSDKKYAWILVLCLFTVEVQLNTIMTFKQLSNASEIESFQITNSSYENAVKAAEEDAKDEIFYRLEFSRNLNYNNPALYNYNGVAIFSSIRNGKIMAFFDDYFDYTIKDRASIEFNMSNPYMTSILGIKYFNGTEGTNYYDYIDVGEISILKNNDALSLGYMVNNSIYNYEFSKDTKVLNIKELENSMLDNEEPVYTVLDNFIYNGTERVYSEETKKTTINRIPGVESPYTSIVGIAPYDGFLYYNKSSAFYTNAVLYINGTETTIYNIENTAPLFLHEGDSYEIRFTATVDYEIKHAEYYLLKFDTYKSFINELKQNELEITKYDKDSHLEGYVTSTDNKNVLFTTIPYDKGWTIKIDNKKVSYKSCYNAFVCLDLEEGKHKIEFNYIPKYFIIGSIISIMSLLVSIFYIRKNKVRK